MSIRHVAMGAFLVGLISACAGGSNSGTARMTSQAFLPRLVTAQSQSEHTAVQSDQLLALRLERDSTTLEAWAIAPHGGGSPQAVA